MKGNKFKDSFQLGIKLAKVNFKLRNEGSFFGLFWYLIDPLLLFSIILVIRSAVGGNAIEEYPLYLLLGLMMFNLFSGITSKSINLMQGNSNFIKSVKMNPESIVFSQVIEALFGHLFEILIFVGFMFYFDANIIWILAYPIILIFYFIFTLGMAFLLATSGVFIVDLSNVWKVITKLLFFLTPLFYFAKEGTLIYTINHLNPLYYFITISRDMLVYNTLPNSSYVLGTIILSLLVLCIGYIFFRKNKLAFAELV